MLSYDEFVKSFNPELVGDRLIGMVDGVRHFVGEFVDGVFTLTEHGRKLVNGTVQEVEDMMDTEVVVTARKRGRPAAE
jgi:hypothetical protein